MVRRSMSKALPAKARTLSSTCRWMPARSHPKGCGSIQPARGSPERAPMAEGTPKQGSVLIVEDDQGVREALRLALEIEGFRVSLAVNGEQALRVLEGSEGIGLILLDL